jgi:uracil-DNA glycosylase
VNDRTTALNNLKQLIELDQAAGIEFILRESTAASTPTITPDTPVKTVVSSKPVAPNKPAVSMKTEAPTKPVTRIPESTVSIAPTSTVPANYDSLDSIAQAIAHCKACRLCDGRRNTVPGEGHHQPTLLFVGEGPGAEEDAQGRPFVGAAGQLLDKMIIAMGLSREQVFIANIIKCRPPGNRTPEADEVSACLHFLERQIALLKPMVICALGNTPLRALTGNDKAGITRMRGQQLTYRGITMIPTFHPSFLLRNPDAKKPCWEDLQTVLKAMGREPPKRG